MARSKTYRKKAPAAAKRPARPAGLPRRLSRNAPPTTQHRKADLASSSYRKQHNLNKDGSLKKPHRYKPGSNFFFDID